MWEPLESTIHGVSTCSCMSVMVVSNAIPLNFGIVASFCSPAESVARSSCTTPACAFAVWAPSGGGYACGPPPASGAPGGCPTLAPMSRGNAAELADRLREAAADGLKALKESGGCESNRTARPISRICAALPAGMYFGT